MNAGYDGSYSSQSIPTKIAQRLVAALAGSIGLLLAGYLIVRFLYALSYINNDAAPANGVLTENLASTLPFLCAVVFIITVPVFSSLFICAVSLTMFPSMSIREDGFKVHSVLGKSEWLGWDAIKKARKIGIPQRSWMIGVELVINAIAEGSIDFATDLPTENLVPLLLSNYSHDFLK